jgi:hypothetical protein
MRDLIERLRMTSNMINMGEKISWGQDTGLMDEAADAIEALQARAEKAEAELREARMQMLSDAGQAAEAYEAQLRAEAACDAVMKDRAQIMRERDAEKARAETMHRRAQKAEGLLERMARFMNTWEAVAKRRKDYWVSKYVAAAARHVRSRTGVAGQMQYAFYEEIVRKRWALEKERDAALAKVERLRGLLSECADDLESYINAEYPMNIRDAHPSVERRYLRDMELVTRVRAALAGDAP